MEFTKMAVTMKHLREIKLNLGVNFTENCIKLHFLLRKISFWAE